MIGPSSLDIDGVAAFLHAAELSSFTRAAVALGTTQSLVSTRVKRLEEVLGHALLQRHPRLVRLTSDGERFLPAARDLLLAHGRACSVLSETVERIAIGISEQAVGTEAPALLARLAGLDPGLVIDLRIAPSASLDEAFARGDLDVVVVLRLGRGGQGEILRQDRFGWFAAAGLIRRPAEPLPLISLMSECRLRAHGLAELDRAGIAWREAVIGGGMAAVQAAVQGGLGVSPLALRIAPAGCIEVGLEWGLPDLGPASVALRSNVTSPRRNALVRELAAAFRAGR